LSSISASPEFVDSPAAAAAGSGEGHSLQFISNHNTRNVSTQQLNADLFGVEQRRVLKNLKQQTMRLRVSKRKSHDQPFWRLILFANFPLENLWLIVSCFIHPGQISLSFNRGRKKKGES
jgi:hypothetical protein